MGLDAAHYKMLCNLCNQNATPSELFLTAVQSSCLAQQMADLSYHVQWSRHLLSCLCGILGADLLIGARAVVFNPHFRYFFSPDVRDSELGSIQSWPAGSALLLLDSFEPTQRAQILVQASNHRGIVWVLRQDQTSVTAASDLLSLRRYQSLLVALPPKSLALHPMSCWQDLRWDSKHARFSSQVRVSTMANEGILRLALLLHCSILTCNLV